MLTLGYRVFFRGGGPGGAAIRFGDVGADPSHGTGPGKLSTRCQKADIGEIAKETGGGVLVIPTSGGSDGGGRL